MRSGGAGKGCMQVRRCCYLGVHTLTNSENYKTSELYGHPVIALSVWRRAEYITSFLA